MNYIEKYLEYLKVNKKYSDNTIISYKDDLIEYYNILNHNIININQEIVREYLQYLHNGKINRNSISRKLSSVRSFYNYLCNMNIIEQNYFNDVHNPKKEQNLPKILKETEINKLFEVSDSTNPLSQRNQLIIEMLYATGVRVSELVNIKIKDIDNYNNSIKILGKGKKMRIVYFGSFCKKSLITYLNDGRSKLNTKNSEYLFLNKNGNKISDRMIRNILNDLIIKTDVNKQISPHTIRHTFATEMLNNGSDLLTVKELLGHENINTTSIYTHITDEQIKKVYDNCHPRAKER